MAWIESHQELGRHPKTRRLAKMLGVSRPAVVGHLHYLWWWAMDFAQDGDITEFDNDELAEAALWDGDSVDFFQSLASSGFIDTIKEPGQDTRHTLHDWDHYAGKLVAHRKANADKQKVWRDRQKDNVTAAPTETAGGVTVTLPSALPSRDGATVPYRTVPNPTEQNADPEGARVISETDPLPEAAQTDEAVKAAPKSPRQHDPAAFDAFWLLYPKKVGKDDAQRAWQGKKPDPETQRKILAGVRALMAQPDWDRENRKFVPNPATFLNGRRWEDELTPPLAPPTVQARLYDVEAERARSAAQRRAPPPPGPNRYAKPPDEAPAARKENARW